MSKRSDMRRHPDSRTQKRNHMATIQNEAYRAKLPYEALAKLPDAQIGFLLTATRIANDVLLLQRVLIACETNRNAGDADEVHASTGAWFSLVTMLAGKLWEGHAALSKYAKLWRPGAPLALSKEVEDARKALNTHFANGSPLYVVRNKSAFHYDTKEVLSAEVSAFKAQTAGTGDMEWIMGSELVNTLYAFSTASNGFATLDAAFPNKSRQEQMDGIYDVTIDAARIMGDFIQHGFAAILAQPGIEADDRIELVQIDMSSRPTIDSVRLPTLVRVTK